MAQLEGSRDRFSVELRPNRSLGPRGFAILMSLVGLVSFGAGAAFMAAGAWPVFGFFGLDALLIYCAFRLNYRAGEVRETLDITGEELIHRRLAPGRPVAEQRFVRGWVQVELWRDEERELVGPLILRSRGKRHEVGRFLGAEDRISLADALRAALARPNI